jgi:hypothetical protein
LWWYRTMLNFCDILVGILKMATSRNWSMSGINSGHHYLPTYQIVMISDNVEFLPPQYHPNSTLSNFNAISYVGTLCCLELIPDVEQFLPVAIFKMATTISQKINIVRYHHNLICGCWIFAIFWWAFWKWQPVEIDQCRESIRDIIIYPHIKLWWYSTMLIFCDIVVAILKMATSRNCSRVHYVVSNWFLTLNNFYRSPFSKWPPQYRKKSTLSDIITIWYVGR